MHRPVQSFTQLLAAKVLLAILVAVFSANIGAAELNYGPFKVGSGAGVEYSAAGPDAASITQKVTAFRNALGTNNLSASGSQTTGRREINWDGVPADSTLPNSLAPDFFNTTSTRGLFFKVADELLLVSQPDDSGVQQFGDVNQSYIDQFEPFSAEKLFASQQNTVTVEFEVPGALGTKAAVRGFGAVFTDVEQAGSTTITFYKGTVSLGKYTVPSNPVSGGGLSFLGVDFGENIVTSVVIQAGTASITDISANDISNGGDDDLVVMDDFIYGEPVAIAISEDQTLVTSSNNGNVLRMLDTGSTLTTKLTCPNGVLKLALIDFLIVTGDGTNTITITGMPVDINNALNGLSFTPTANYSGLAEIVINTVNTANGTSDTDIMPVIVYPVVDQVQLVAMNLYGTENTPLHLDVTVTSEDTDGSEVQKITLHNVPQGIVVSGGTQVGFADYEIQAANISNATIIFQDNIDFFFDIEGTTTETLTGESNSITTTIFVSVVNLPPIANTGGPYTLNEGSTLQLSGSANDSDTVTFLWDLDGDNIFGEVGANAANGDEIGPNPILKAQNLQRTDLLDGPKIFTLSLIVTDKDGASSEVATTTVTVLDVPPTVQLSSNQATVAEGSDYTLKVGVPSDPALTLDTITGGVIHWGDGSQPTPYNINSGSYTHVYANGSPAGLTRNINIDLVDEDGTHSAAGTLTVKVFDVPPQVTISGVGTVMEGAIYTLTVNNPTDPGNDIISGGTIDWGDGSNTSGYVLDTTDYTHIYANGTAAGSVYTISLSLTDNDGSYPNIATQQVTVMNAPPTINAGGPYSVVEGGTVILMATASDPGDDALTVVWDLDGDGIFGETGSDAHNGNETGLTPTFNAQNIDGPAVVTVSARVTDADGATSTTTATINVANVAPGANLSGAATVHTGATYTLSVSPVTDPGSDTATGVIHWGDGASSGFTVSGNYTHIYTTGSVAGVARTITLDLTDEDGAYPQVSELPITVVNTAPVIASVATATPENPASNQTVQFTVAATDADGDTLTYAWAFGDGGTASGNNPTHAYPVDGSYTATVTISDGLGESVTSQVTVTVKTPLPLLIKALTIKLNFVKTGTDSIAVSGTVAVPVNFSAPNLAVKFDVGGNNDMFVLDIKGKTPKKKTNVLTLGKRSAKTGAITYVITMTKGNFRTALEDENLTSRTTKKDRLAVRVTLYLGDLYFARNQNVEYTATLGKTGSTKAVP